MTNPVAGRREPPRRPKVTIAIPTFNRASWVKGGVLAALAQTYQDFEIVVSDNASTDETRAVLAEFDDYRLRVIGQERNLGMAGNWNACLAEARGEYIALVPDDDRIAPWFLERCLALVEREPGLPIVIALSDLRLAVEGGRTLRTFLNRRFATGIWDGTVILHEFLEDRISAQMCSILVRVDTLRARGGFPVELPFSLDKAGWSPVLLKGRAGFVNESCGTFNEHETNHTNSLDVDLCLGDEWKFADLLMTMAREQVEDPKKRRNVVLGAKHYFGRRALEILASYRRDGASLFEIAPLVWQWRWSLAHLRVANAFRLARLLSVLLLPRFITGQIRRLKRYLGRDLRVSLKKIASKILLLRSGG
jgi:glycosyltransferase involved in cell wall biosynthesis